MRSFLRDIQVEAKGCSWSAPFSAPTRLPSPTMSTGFYDESGDPLPPEQPTFRPFTRQSLAAINARRAEKKSKSADEQQVSVISGGLRASGPPRVHGTRAVLSSHWSFLGLTVTLESVTNSSQLFKCFYVCMCVRMCIDVPLPLCVCVSTAPRRPQT